MKQFKGSMLLLLTTMLWGIAFTAQTSAADKIPSFTFNAVRCFLAAFFLGMIVFCRNRISAVRKKTIISLSFKNLLCSGMLCGTTLFLGMNLQQFGIAAYPPHAAASGRAGFLTATYVIMIPIVQSLAGKKLRLTIIIAVIGCITGMYLLCMSGGFSGIYLGDILELLCAVGFTAYILAVDRCKDIDGLFVSCMQFIICGLMCAVGMLLTEKPEFPVLANAWLPITYAGIVSSGIGYTLQILGQKDTEPTLASVIMSLESVFAALAGWLILGEVLSPRETIGCILVFASVIAAQIPERKTHS